MKIPAAEITKHVYPVLVRLTPEIDDWLAMLAKETGGGKATVVQQILNAARADGVAVVKYRTQPKRKKS